MAALDLERDVAVHVGLHVGRRIQRCASTVAVVSDHQFAPARDKRREVARAELKDSVVEVIKESARPNQVKPAQIRTKEHWPCGISLDD